MTSYKKGQKLYKNKFLPSQISMQSECPQISKAHTTCKNYVVIVSKPAHLGDQKHQLSYNLSIQK